MRFALNKEQWDKLLYNSEKISDFPATVGNFLQYYTEKKSHGNFNMAFDAKRKVFGVWYDNYLDKFEGEELIDAMFDLFCHLEGIQWK